MGIVPAVPSGRRLGAWALSAGLILGAAACSGESEAADPADEATTTTAADRTTTTTTDATGTTSSTSLPRDGETLDLPTPPALRTGGEDFASIIDQMVFYIGWVYHHPDPALVSNVYVENSPAWTASRQGVQDYVDRGVKDQGEPTAVSNVKVLSTIDANHIVVYAVFTVPPYDVVDAGTGAVVEHRPGRPPAGWSYELVRDPNDPNAHWLVLNRSDLGELSQ